MPSAPHDHVALTPVSAAPAHLLQASREQAGALWFLRSDVQDLGGKIEELTEAFENERLLNVAERAEAAKARAREAHWKGLWTFFAPVVYAIAGGTLLELIRRVMH